MQELQRQLINPDERDKEESYFYGLWTEATDQLVLCIISLFSDCSQVPVSINCLASACIRPFPFRVFVFLLHSSWCGGPPWYPVVSW